MSWVRNRRALNIPPFVLPLNFPFCVTWLLGISGDRAILEEGHVSSASSQTSSYSNAYRPDCVSASSPWCGPEASTTEMDNYKSSSVVEQRSDGHLTRGNSYRLHTYNQADDQAYPEFLNRFVTFSLCFSFSHALPSPCHALRFKIVTWGT